MKLSDALFSNRKGPPVSESAIVLAAAIGLASAIGLGALLDKPQPSLHPRTQRLKICAQRARQGSSLLAASVLADSALEHFRGVYSDRLMYVAPVTAATTIAAALARRLPSAIRSSMFGGAFLVGLTGLGFHLYNILKRPGGFSWNNLFYAAPIAAPGALLLSGMLGFAAEQIERGEPRVPSRPRFGELGRALCFAVSGGMLGTVGEVALLHFRGAYHNPFMYAPVTIPPLTAGALAVAGARPAPGVRRTAQWMLKLTAVLGLIGSAFHIYGVQRNMGGWRNWTQNLFAGPPIPAPPGFTGLALAGLGALHLLEGSDRRRSHS